MQHHQGGAAGYLFGPPPTGMASHSPATMSVSTAPYPSPMLPQPTGEDFDELAAAVTGTGGGSVSFHHEEDDMPVEAGCGRSASEVAGAGGPGSRWPREETVALIRIRSEMDAAFRNAALKAPIWEEVSRKLAELGYRRGAKKCKEKFENVDKYYKRTKEGRAGRQDGKSYRFFSELEALHAAAPQQDKAMATTACTTETARFPQPLAMATQMPPAVLARAVLLPDLSFSSNSESDSDDESDEEEEAGGSKDEGFCKLTTGGDFGERNKTMMALFEGMINRITEKQDASHRLFLETLEKWEADRTAREDAWRRQELARMSREREQHARERAASAARDAALIAFLQRVGGDSVLHSPVAPGHTKPRLDAPAASLKLVVARPKAEEGGRAGGGESSGGLSRWPKEEVEALIQLRMEKDEHYQGMGTGAKGPLWEDISAGMRRIGYDRSSKRCKEKWENINKYFKKVKESRKRRPEDSKTCPYFHQLDAIYRKKQFVFSGGSSSASGNTTSQQENAWRELEGKISNDCDKRYIVGGGSSHARPGIGNGETSPATTVLDDIGTNKKAEDSNMTMATEANLQSEKKEFTAPDQTDNDDMECNYADEGDEDCNEDGKMKCVIEFQKSETRSSSTPAPAPAATIVASSAPTSSTFLAVQ